MSEHWDGLSVQWLCWRAQLLSRNGFVHRGLVYQLVAYHMQPEDTEVLHGLAKLFASSGDGERALAVIKKMEEKDVNEKQLSVLRVNAYRAMGRLQEARGLLVTQTDEPKAEQ